MMKLRSWLRKRIVRHYERDREMTNNVLKQAHRAVTVAYQNHLNQESLSGAKCREAQRLLYDELKRRGIYK